MTYALLILGLYILSKGADFLVDGASAIARRLGVSSLLVGLTVVAFGTSLPELFVNSFAALRGSTELALGNVLGSNIANLLLILGCTTLVLPPKIAKSTVWREIPFSVLATVVLGAFASQALFSTEAAALNRTSGIILLLFFVAFLYYLFSTAVNSKRSSSEDSSANEGLLRSIGMIVLGLAGLYFGAEWTVSSAVSIAKGFGVSDYVISATIVALGTSLPELITSLKAAMRGNSDLAVGNIVGSNIFNIFFILGVTAVIAPVSLPQDSITDIMVLLIASLVLFGSMFLGKKHHFDRWQGGIFLAGYCMYIAHLVIRT